MIKDDNYNKKLSKLMLVAETVVSAVPPILYKGNFLKYLSKIKKLICDHNWFFYCGCCPGLCTKKINTYPNLKKYSDIAVRFELQT